jgi:hypothetical protein
MRIPVLSYISCFSALAPIVFGVSGFRRQNRSMHWLLVFCIVLFSEHCIQLMYSILGWNNWTISRYGTLVETIILALVYLSAIRTSAARKGFTVFVVLSIIIWGAVAVLYHSADKLDSSAFTLGMMIAICYGLSFLFLEFRHDHEPITLNPTFWAATGSLLYNVGALIIIGLANELLKMGYEYFYQAWQINFILIMIANGCYLKGFLCKTA